MTTWRLEYYVENQNKWYLYERGMSWEDATENVRRYYGQFREAVAPHRFVSEMDGVIIPAAMIL